MDGGERALEVVGAVITVGGRILAAHRPATANQEAGWEFPGGKVEPGETPQVALAREIREELGVSIVVGPLVARATVQTDLGAIDLACYRATALDQLPTQSQVHDKLKWVGPQELGALAWLAPDRPTARALMAWGSAGPSAATQVRPAAAWHQVWS